MADQRRQDDALQAYLDRIGNLLFDKDTPSGPHGAPPGVRTLARAHTLTILPRLDPGRKRSVLDFLYEADLIKTHQCIINLGSPDLMYSAADLSGANLRGAFLKSACLSGHFAGANLSGADLSGASGVDEGLLEQGPRRGWGEQRPFVAREHELLRRPISEPSSYRSSQQFIFSICITLRRWLQKPYPPAAQR